MSGETEVRHNDTPPQSLTSLLDLKTVLSERAIAAALRPIADDLAQDQYHHVASILHTIADALDNPKAEYQLNIRRVGAPGARGRRSEPSAIDEQRLQFVVNEMREQWRQGDNAQMESAIAAATAKFGCSRATIFSSLAKFGIVENVLLTMARRDAARGDESN